jgi:BirA family transcriptional regulator, biotin operon repressor / biotin---[acetyl-CoA-carboxylase] ligase
MLGARARAAGFSHRHLPVVGSTNAEALRIGADRLWLTADEQSEGRGRRGRAWSSPPGNLYASLCLRDPAPPRRAADLCFVAALSLSDAICEAIPGAASQLSLKWPNDLLLGGAKVAGILVEAAHAPNGFTAVIGIGVNIAHCPEGLAYPAARLGAIDPSLAPARLFEALSDCLALRLVEWRGGEGFAPIRKAWLDRASGLGEPILVRLPSGDIDGVFESLAEDGSLVLRQASGRRVPVSAGEIFFSRLLPDGETR